MPKCLSVSKCSQRNPKCPNECVGRPAACSYLHSLNSNTNTHKHTNTHKYMRAAARSYLHSSPCLPSWTKVQVKPNTNTHNFRNTHNYTNTKMPWGGWLSHHGYLDSKLCHQVKPAGPKFKTTQDYNSTQSMQRGCSWF